MKIYRILGYQSEYQQLEAMYAREERRHARAALLGALTALGCFAGLVWLLS